MKTIQPATVSRLGSAFAGLILLTLLTSSSPTALAAPVTSKQAAAAVTGWLSLDRTPLRETLGASVQRVETFSDKAGTPLYYVVYLDPSGFVVVAGDDLVEPIIGFARAGQFDASTANPLGDLVSKDVPARVAHVRLAGSAATEPSAIQAQSKWQRLAPTDGGPVITSQGLATVSDVRVAPLTQTTWDQQTAAGAGTTACYNYYTPPNANGSTANYPAGCVATAMAQLLRYYQFPSAGVGSSPFTIYVNGSPSTYYLRGGDGGGGPYVWSSMPLLPPATPTAAQCQAIGALVADAGATVNMQYASGGSSSVLLNTKTALTATFQFSNAIKGYNNNSDLGAGLVGMINPNLDARYPVLLGIEGSSGHAVVADGYGYSASTLYHHLNLGWSGVSSAWYALPLIDTSSYTFTVVDSCVYNAYTNGSGEIISGRVLDQISRPVVNATVTVTGTGGGPYTTTTDSQGIYALARIPSGTSYSITVTKANYSPVSGNFSTGTSSDRAATSGNLWGANFTMNMLTTVLDHLVWNAVASPQSLSTPFPVTITAQNLLNAPATSFTGPVALSAYASGLGASVTIIGNLAPNATLSGSEMTHGYSFTPSANVLVTAVRSYSSDKVSIWTDGGTLLGSQSTSSSGSWVETSMATPITLSAGTPYRVSVHIPAGTPGRFRTTSWPTTFANGTVGQNFYWSYGDIFPTSIYGTSQGPMVDLRYSVAFSNSVPVSPTSSGVFANGVWSGNITVLQAATNIVLKADDSAGHVALSSPFNVIDPNAAPPNITTQPQSRTNNTGDNATFSLIVASGQTPSYTWRRNSSPIGGATASSYTLNNVQLPDSGSLFSCVVSNSYGAVTSQTATLTVICSNVVLAAQPNVTLNSGGAIYAVAPLADGSVIFGGYFTNVNGVARSRLARILANGALDMTWNPAPNASVYALAVSSTSLYVGGTFTSIGTLNRSYIAKLSTTGTGAADATWNPAGADYYVSALAVDGTDLYAGGEFWLMGTQSRNCVAKLSMAGAGTVDATWNPNATIYGRVDAIAVSGANVYIGGTFTNVSNLALTNLAKMSTTGSGAADPTWRPNANWEVYAVATSGTDVYVAGGFTYVSGQYRNCIAKLSSTGAGAADATWNPNADNGVWALAVKGLCVYAGGSFANIGGLSRAGLAKLSTSGTGAADAAWEADCDGEVDVVALGSTALYVGGGFTHVAGQARPGVAALTFATPCLLSPQRSGGGQFQCTLAGERGHRYDILTSTNLVNWDPFTNLVSSTGTTNFTDPTAGLKRRFYRARSAP